jgi:hypothetical protein
MQELDDQLQIAYVRDGSRPSAVQIPVPHNGHHVGQLEYHDKPSGERHQADAVDLESRSWCLSAVAV